MPDRFPTFRRWLDCTKGFLLCSGTWSTLARPLAVLDRSRRGVLTLGWKQWLALMGLLAGLLIVVDIAVPSNPLRVWYWMSIVGPSQEHRFGFRTRLATDCPYDLQVTHVDPNGPFDRAGVKPGFVFFEPSCFGVHSCEPVFRALRDAKAGFVTLRFLTGGWNGADQRVRALRVEVPSSNGAT